MWCIVYYQKCGVTIRFVTVCLLGNVVQHLLPIVIRFVTVCLLGYVVYCLLPKMQSYHQVCYCVSIRKCSTVFITSNHQVCYCMFIRICSVLFITKNVELPLGLLLCVYQKMQCIVYYQKCGVIIRFVTVCLLGNVVYCCLPKMQSNHQVCYCVFIRICSVLLITKNAELPLGLLLCVYQEMQYSVYYQ